MTDFFQIDGFKIEKITVVPSTDVRHLSQRQLWDMGTVGAHAELRRRAAIVALREGAPQ